MKNWTDVNKANATGQYQFQFLPGPYASAIMDESITFDQFAADPDVWFAQEFRGARHKYTSAEMESTWLMIIVQRKVLEAALMIVSGKYKGINQGLRELKIFD